jgi:hypothetical protein
LPQELSIVGGLLRIERVSATLAPDGKRVAVVIREGAAQVPQREHEIVMLQDFAEELRRRVPVGK